MSNNPAQKKEWKALQEHSKAIQTSSLNSLFAEDKDRFSKFSTNNENLLFDYSKQRVTKETIDLLMELAAASKLEEKREDFFSGATINHTEGRAVLHTALRDPQKNDMSVDGENVSTFVENILNKMESFCRDVHSGSHTGFTGKAIKHVVSIGIGGSDLGPRMVVNALRCYQTKGITPHFVANIDGADLDAALQKIDPETTLFVVASKTFTTQETLANAHTAKKWLIKKLGSEDCISRHFIALSTNIEAATTFGIKEDNIFPFKDWVGGRFSLWSAIGLSIMLTLGVKAFRDLLGGAHAMDTHFRTAKLKENIPVLLAMIGVWNRNFLGWDGLAILPYAQDLTDLPLFLQQLEMESNGKNVDNEGNPITDYHTAPIIFGQAGTNGQHAFYQMMHQGTITIPADFIGFREPNHTLAGHHTLLNNNMVAQSQALMKGRTLEEADNNPHRVFKGNHPSSTLILDKLDPHSLGMLLALYEHKVFVQGVIWNINSFDQYGVELGKELAKKLESGKIGDVDSSTSGLLRYIRAKS
jgi:glucose-6-phosphate isomerase